MYTYKAHVVSVYDGDTLTVDIDLGFDIHFKDMKIRMYGIDTPEIRGTSRPKGLISRDALRERILGKDVIVRTIRDTQEKYGRYLAVIDLDGENINRWMVVNKYAVEYMDTGE
jgi:micrococcal nuclease